MMRFKRYKMQIVTVRACMDCPIFNPSSSQSRKDSKLPPGLLLPNQGPLVWTTRDDGGSASGQLPASFSSSFHGCFPASSPHRNSSTSCPASHRLQPRPFQQKGTPSPPSPRFPTARCSAGRGGRELGPTGKGDIEKGMNTSLPDFGGSSSEGGGDARLPSPLVEGEGQAPSPSEVMKQGGEEQEDSSPPVLAALAALRFYKSVLSPMMPSSCRYQPTCSSYSYESYQKFGVWKGTVLTSWRILRCNPWGGRGYDPPSWPPKGLELIYGRDLVGAPQVSVVFIAYTVYFVLHAVLVEICGQ